jgi:MFS family permease
LNNSANKSATNPQYAITAFFMLSGGTFGVWASRIPAVAEYHNLSKQALGLLLLILAVGALFSFSVAGWASDRFGAKRVCQITGVLIALSLIAVGISPDIYTVSIAIFLFGAGHGSCDIAMNVWATEWETKSGKSVMGFFHAMWSVGGGLGASTGVLAAYFSVSYAIHFSVVAIALCVLAQLIARSSWSVVDSKPSKVKAFQLPKGNLMWVGLIGFCASIVEGSITDWSAIALITLAKASEAQAALGYTTFSIAMVATRLSAHVLMRQYSVVHLSQFCAILTAIAMLLTVATSNMGIAIIGYGMAGIGVALFFPLIFQRAGNDPFVPRGTAIASVATLGYGGMLFGPPLIGWIADMTSLRVSFVGIAFLCLFIVAQAHHLAPPKAKA